ncbi:MAG: hypothetical protein V4543_11090 [Bacteroidota bacterium]
MYSLFVYRSASVWHLPLLKAADFFGNSAKSISGRFARYIACRIDAYIAADFRKRADFFDQISEAAQELSLNKAIAVMNVHKELISTVYKLDELIQQSDSEILKSSFFRFTKAIFKYESKLHRRITENTPVEQTPQYVKDTMAALRRNSILQLTEKGKI